MSELKDREIGGKSSLVALLSHDTHTNVCGLDHAYIIASVTYT